MAETVCRPEPEGVVTYLLPNDKPYLDQTCPQCGRSNRECYEDVADAQGITLEEAMRQFPPKTALSEPGASVTKWSPGWVPYGTEESA